MVTPITCAPASDARCTSSAATCAGCTHCNGSALGSPARFAGVSIVPGSTVFAEMPRYAVSRRIGRLCQILCLGGRHCFRRLPRVHQAADEEDDSGARVADQKDERVIREATHEL